MAEIGGQSSAANAAQHTENEKELMRQRTEDLENRRVSESGKEPVRHQRNEAITSSSGSDLSKEIAGAYTKGPSVRVAVVQGQAKPMFHIDLTSALQSAIANVEMRGTGGVAKGVGTEGN